MNPPPPTPFIGGSSTPIASAVVIAASTALPPSFRTCRPASAASGCLAATMPWSETASFLENSQFVMFTASLPFFQERLGLVEERGDHRFALFLRRGGGVAGHAGCCHLAIRAVVLDDLRILAAQGRLGLLLRGQFHVHQVRPHGHHDRGTVLAG